MFTVRQLLALANRYKIGPFVIIQTVATLYECKLIRTNLKDQLKGAGDKVHEDLSLDTRIALRGITQQFSQNVWTSLILWFPEKKIDL